MNHPIKGHYYIVDKSIVQIMYINYNHKSIHYDLSDLVNCIRIGFIRIRDNYIVNWSMPREDLPKHFNKSNYLGINKKALEVFYGK